MSSVERSSLPGAWGPLVASALVLLLGFAVQPVGGVAGEPADAPRGAPAAPEEKRIIRETTPVEPEGAKATTLPAGVLARVDGRDILVKEYADYLLASVGRAKLGEYIDRLLVAAEAQRQDIVLPPDEIEALVNARIERTVEGIYQGDRARYEKSLVRQGTTLEDRKEWLRHHLYYDGLLTKIILKGRKVSGDAVTTEFTRMYGSDGVTLEIRHILVSTGRRTGPTGAVLAPRARTDARRRAEKILAELRGGGDFVALVRKYCDDTFTRQADGRIPGYRKGLFGPTFHAEVEKLSKAHPLSGVVESPRGFHIVEFLERKVTELKDVQDQLLDDLKRRLPSAKERLDAMARLRKAADVVR